MQTSHLQRSYTQYFSQSEYSPDEDARQKVRPAKSTSKTSNSRRLHKKDSFNSKGWSVTENLLYRDFLRNNEELFTRCLKDKKTLKINVQMSQYIKTRSSNQCRSHHQKMMKYHKSIPAITSFVDRLQKEQILAEKQQSQPDLQLPLVLPEIELQAELKEILNLDQLPCTLWYSLLQEEVSFSF